MIDLPPAQVHCVAQAIFHESRGEPLVGQKAVAHVVLNRAKSRNITPCQVLRQPKQFQIKLRQSYVGQAWKDAYRIASNPGRDPTSGAIYFKTTNSRVSWKFHFLTKIGGHNFYR